jgi:hypothetical protein
MILGQINFFSGPERSLSFFVESPNLKDSLVKVSYLGARINGPTSSYWIGKSTKRRLDSFNKGSSPKDDEF